MLATAVNNGTAGPLAFEHLDGLQNTRAQAGITGGRRHPRTQDQLIQDLGQSGDTNSVMSPPSQRTASWTSSRCHAASASTCAAPRRTAGEPLG